MAHRPSFSGLLHYCFAGGSIHIRSAIGIEIRAGHEGDKLLLDRVVVLPVLCLDWLFDPIESLKKDPTQALGPTLLAAERVNP